MKEQEIITFKASGKRSAVKITLKYNNLTTDDINNNIKPRLKRTLKNFDALWTTCEGIPEPIRKREVLVEIVVFDEPKKRFQAETKDESDSLGKTYYEIQGKKCLAVCWVYRANEKGPADIKALEHEFGHALMIYWMGKHGSVTSKYFAEGCAELIAHGWGVCSHFKKLLQKCHKRDALNLKKMKIIGSKEIIKTEEYSDFYRLPYIKLAYLREKSPKFFSKLVEHLIKNNYKEAQALNQNFYEQHNGSFQQWVDEHRAIQAEDPNYTQCIVDVCGSVERFKRSKKLEKPKNAVMTQHQTISLLTSRPFLAQSSSNTTVKSSYLEKLFINEGAKTILKIWDISTIEELYKKITFSDEKTIQYFVNNVEEVVGTTHLNYVFARCGLDSMINDQTSYLQPLKAWKDYLLDNIQPKKDSPAHKLLRAVSNTKKGTIFTLLRTCDLLATCTTFYDFCCFCKAVQSVLQDKSLCKEILESEDCSKSFKKNIHFGLDACKIQVKRKQEVEACDISKNPSMNAR